MQGNKKTLKIYSSTGKPTPKITLQGKWLTDFGFTIGGYIELTLLQDQIIITRVSEPTQLPRKKMKATLPTATIFKVKETALSYQISEETLLEKALIYYFKSKGVM